MHILGGLIGAVIGFLLIKYSVPLTDTFGRIQWAEDHMRGGLAGTYSLYKIVGVIFIVLSFMYMFNLMGFLLGPLAPLFGGSA